eukprot:EC125079.1.p1 GENE.EC125079.1~~EC125079.1.p1  ORF type:complete len:191 (+),score=11.94 EC125079.1:48-620(+)
MSSLGFLSVCSPPLDLQPFSHSINSRNFAYDISLRAKQPLRHPGHCRCFAAVLNNFYGCEPAFSTTRSLQTPQPSRFISRKEFWELRGCRRFALRMSASSEDLENKFAIVIEPNDRLTFGKLQQVVPSLSDRDAAVDVMLKAVISGEAVVAVYGDRDEASSVANKLEALALIVSVVPAASVAHLVNCMSS